MMGMTVKTLYRFECDRCGAAQEYPSDTVDGCLAVAEKQGWVVSNWMLDGQCARQTCFCAECVQKLADEAARKVAGKS